MECTEYPLLNPMRRAYFFNTRSITSGCQCRCVWRSWQNCMAGWPTSRHRQGVLALRGEAGKRGEAWQPVSGGEVPPRLTGSQPYALAGGEHAGTTGWDRAIRPPRGVPHLAREAGRAETEGQRRAGAGRATAVEVASTARDNTSVAPRGTTAGEGGWHRVRR